MLLTINAKPVISSTPELTVSPEVKVKSAPAVTFPPLMINALIEEMPALKIKFPLPILVKVNAPVRLFKAIEPLETPAEVFAPKITGPLKVAAEAALLLTVPLPDKPAPLSVRDSAFDRLKPFKSNTPPEATVVPAAVVPSGEFDPLLDLPIRNVPVLIVVVPE